MSIEKVLDKYFTIKSLKSVQKEIIENILEKQNVLAILPTGYGKSICYQIPAILSENFSIVISPLIALMKDQVDSLNKKEKVASFINSTLSEKEIENVFQEINNGIVKLLYVSPEKLQNKFFTERIKNLHPSFLFVDEAHCISEWGHNFRPSYLKIKEFVNYCNIKNISAFTATATEEVRNDITRLLDLNNPKVFVKGFERKNLSLNVFSNVDKKSKLLEILNTNLKPAIVYTSTRKYCEDISEFLKKNKIKASYYHAGLSSEVKKIIQDDFINDKTEVIVATNAFGMGIDKNNIRTIIHYNMPGSIENYYQEIGRAGRDNLNSNIFLLYDYRDKEIQEYFIDNSNPTITQIEMVYDTICDYGKVALGFINDKPIPIDKNLTSLFELKDINKSIFETSLNVLSNSGYLSIQNQYKKDFLIKLNLSKEKLYDYLKNESSQEEKDLIVLLIKKYSHHIFENRNKIIIENLAFELETYTTNILSSLETLFNKGIIDLTIPSNYQEIFLTTPRVRSKDLKLNLDKVNSTYKYFKHKLNKMVDFVFTKNCRMNFIINYFGQNEENYKCNICDNCTENKSTSNSQFEYLEEIIIKTIEEIKQPIKINSLIKILRGNSKITSNSISTFGSCEHFSSKEIETIIENLVSKRILDKFKDTLKLSKNALDIILNIDDEIDNNEEENSYDIELYNKLKTIRKETAEKFNQSEKLICNDELLIKIAKEKPKTISELLSIDGFTQRMFNKIGEAVLFEIKNFEKTNDKFYNSIIELINKKYSFDEIVSLTKIPESILALNIVSLIDTNSKLDYSNLIPQKEFAKIKEKVDEGFIDLNDLFVKLDKKIGYNKIKITLKLLSI